MTVATKNSIRALPLNSEEVMFDELNLTLNLTKHTLERLIESDQAQIPKEELSNDLLKIFEVSERIKEAETLRQESDIYYSEYRLLSDEIKAKYSDFLTHDTFREIEAHEKYMDGLKELIIAQGIMLLAFEDETDQVRQYGTLYTGMVRLSDLVEKYILYFPQGLIEYIRNTAAAFLIDSSFRPDRVNQNESIFSYLVGLKNTARSILWQIEEHRTKNEESLLTVPFEINLALARAMQVQKNQAAMDWTKLRLEQIRSIRREKG